MGKMEDRTKRKIRRTKIQQAILTTIFLAGFVSIAVLAPNAMVMLRSLGLKDTRRRQYTIKSSINRLITNGYIRYENRNGLKVAILTPLGKQVVDVLVKHDYKLNKPKKWDGKWRIVSFDIWEKRKDVRLRLREILLKIGFVKLQNSVWVYPYDCEDVVNIVKTELRLGRGTLYIIADQIENDHSLRKHFNLQSS